MANFYNRFTNRQFNPNAFLKFNDIDPRVQKHLAKVYATLAAAVLVSAVGIGADVAFHVGGALTMLGAFISLAWLGFTPATADNQAKRYALLGAFAFCQGTSLGPLVGAALAINPALLLTAALSTAAVFASFTLSALLTQRRSYLFLGGYLSSAVTGMLVMRLAGWMFGFGRLGFELELYLGLLVFAGYVLFDTQLVVERASAGDMDNIGAACDLFVDFMAIAVRVLVILLKNEERRENERRRKRQ